MSLPFSSRFDQCMAESGLPAVFTVGPRGQLRLDGDRTREAWDRATGPVEYGLCHCLYRDRATSWVQYVLVSSPALCTEHPRADIRRFSTPEAALDALEKLGRPPVAPWISEP